MILSKKKPPTTQRIFASNWAELGYLCKKIHYWLYARNERGKARRYANRLNDVLHDLPENPVAILRQEGFALLYELQGNLGKAIAHRSREIDLMERLQEEAKSHDAKTRAYMLRGRDEVALKDRRRILEAVKKRKLDGAVPGMANAH